MALQKTVQLTYAINDGTSTFQLVPTAAGTIISASGSGPTRLGGSYGIASASASTQNIVVGYNATFSAYVYNLSTTQDITLGVTYGSAITPIVPAGECVYLPSCSGPAGLKVYTTATSAVYYYAVSGS